MQKDVRVVLTKKGSRWVIQSEYSSGAIGCLDEVYYDKSFLYIDGGIEEMAMLNIESLPLLRRVLKEIAAEIKSKKKPPGSGGVACAKNPKPPIPAKGYGLSDLLLGLGKEKK